MWIDESVIIDFKLPKDIQGIADLCEETDKNEDYAYDNWADLLDILCKEAVVQGHMTKRQWDTVVRRYRIC